MAFRFINIVRERFPLTRSDDKVLVEQKLGDKGFQIIWFLQSTVRSSSKVVREGNNTYFVGANGLKTGLVTRLCNNLKFFFNTLRIFRVKKPYDFIQVKDLYFSGVLGLILAKLKRVPFCFWLSFPFPESSSYKAREGTARYPVLYAVRGRMLGFLEYKILMPMADHIFVQSEQMLKDLERHGISTRKMTSIPMGVSLEDFPKKPELESDYGERHAVAYLGSMNKVRHLEFVLRAFAIVIDQVDDAVLLMIGGGDEEDDVTLLCREAARLGLKDRVVFTGQLPRNSAFALVRKAAVCLSPFFPTFIFNSTSPTKLVEYMALGKACVATEHPEQRQVLTESGAGWCVPWDEEHFARAIVDLLRDQDKAKAMGKKGRLYVERYRNYDILAELLAAKYDEIVLDALE